MTSEEGIYGNVFSIDTDGSEFKNLYNFSNLNPDNGMWPRGSLALSNNKLYGMTIQGGIEGNIFSLDTNGNGCKDMFNFDGARETGASPYGSLTLYGNLLYGMTFAGAVNGGGNIFSIDTDGSGYQDMFDFINPIGAEPWGDLTLSGNMLYGMTNVGGIDSVGVIFKININSRGTAGVNNVTATSASINIYPNPSNGKFNVICHSEQSEESLPQIKVYNVIGEQVYSQVSIIHYPFAIDLSFQPNGIYLYRVISETGNLLGEGKLVIQK